MIKYKLLNTILGTCLLASTSFAADSLSDLKAVENTANPSGSNSPSQVVILNNTPNHLQNQEQISDTYMSSSSVSKQKYRARQGWGTGDSLEDLRNSRINKEAKNEQILMEKLEESRMEDEKSRLRRLFKIREYNRKRRMELGEEDYEFGSLESDYDASVAPSSVVVEKKIVKVVADPSPAPAAEVTSNTTSTVRTKGARYSLMGDTYLRGQIGLGSYQAANATLDTSWGLAFGKDLDPRWYVEVGFFKTAYDVDDPYATPVDVYGGSSQMRSLDQYNFSGVIGLKLINQNSLVGALRGGLSYVRRNSESSDVPGFESFKSNTIDGLLGVGVDFRISENLMVTGNFDYYMNLLSDLASTNSEIVERVEHADYYVLGAGLKLKF